MNDITISNNQFVDFRNLNIRQLMILWMRHNKYSYKEIAKKTECTTNYVGVTINRYYDDSGDHMSKVIQTMREIEDLLNSKRRGDW